MRIISFSCLISISLLCGCAHSVKAPVKISQPSWQGGQGYMYAPLADEPNTYMVIVKGDTEFKLVHARLCDKKLCTEEPVGRAYFIEVHDVQQDTGKKENTTP